MKWEGREESENVEDRRGLGKTAGLAIGGVGGLILLVLGVIAGVDPQTLFKLLGQGQGNVQPADPKGQPGPRADPEEEKLAHFTKVVFHDTEVVWGELF